MPRVAAWNARAASASAAAGASSASGIAVEVDGTGAEAEDGPPQEAPAADLRAENARLKQQLARQGVELERAQQRIAQLRAQEGKT